MGAVQQALVRAGTVDRAATAAVRRAKSLGAYSFGPDSAGAFGLSSFHQQGQNRQRYNLYRGWVYAAINALALEAAGQPAHVGTLGQATEEPGKRKPSGTKTYRTKALPAGLTADPDHPFQDTVDVPNSVQSRFQFVYSFVANLCLTGWAFVAHDTDEETGKTLAYSLPTTWVRPDHTDGPFTRFRVVNPNNPAAAYAGGPLTRDQVEFAFLPNPSDPFAALSPATAQQMAIKIDDHIQTSQSVFFENGVFPSVVVTMGTNPHPNAPAGTRPRLTAPQRRQVIAAIKKAQGGVANYGDPAIVDGLIEKIDRLSATQNEMGWEKSEKAVRTRILSAFGVHPFILGEEMAGSYAQAYIVEERFHRRVNVYLSLLTNLMSQAARKATGNPEVWVWWEDCQGRDPQMEYNKWNAARQRGDVTQDEFRGYLGLPPDEDNNPAEIDKTTLGAVTQVASQASSGIITADQARAILRGMGLSDELAAGIAGTGKDKQEPPTGSPLPVPPTENPDTGEALAALGKAAGLLTAVERYWDPDDAADNVLSEAEAVLL